MRSLITAALVALLAGSAWGAEMRLTRQVSARGDDVTTRLDSTVAEMKGELQFLGCRRVAVAYWSESVPLERLRVEVWCRDAEQDGAVAALPGEAVR